MSEAFDSSKPVKANVKCSHGLEVHLPCPDCTQKAIADAQHYGPAVTLKDATDEFEFKDFDVVRFDKDNTNPKDLLGIKKPQVGLLPGAGKIYGALAMQNGAQKYGPYNWRDKKVKMTIYLDAMERHILALRDGEDLAPDSKVPHLGHIIACAAILADAETGGFLIDDRPLAGPSGALIERYTKK